MPVKERLKVPGNRLVRTIQQLTSRPETRRICLLNEEKRLLEIPVRYGDPLSPAAALEAPVLAAIQAFATLVNECTVEVETAEKPAK